MDSDSIKKGLQLFGAMVGMFIAGGILSHCLGL